MLEFKDLMNVSRPLNLYISLLYYFVSMVEIVFLACLYILLVVLLSFFI